MPFGLSTDIDADFGVCLEGDEGEIGASRRMLVDVFSVGLSGEGFAPFRGATPLAGLGLRGGVEGPERTGDVGAAEVGCELGPPVSFERVGSTETAINVSKSRAFITFSSPV